MSQIRADTSWRHEAAQRAETFAAHHRFIYLILISLLAFIGYAYLFLLPAGAVLGVDYALNAIPNAATTRDWEKIGAMISVALLCGVTCLHVLRLRKPVELTGVQLLPEQAPDMFKLIESVCRQFGHRKIHAVILASDFQLDIRRTPVLGFPLWFTHTLVIGLPLMQTVAPRHFRCELARRIGQHARRGHRVTHNIFLARRLWNEFRSSLAAEPRFGDQLLRWFINAYTPLFDLVSLPAMRRDELAADSAAMDFINDNDVFETIKMTTVGRVFLDTHYWPKVRTMATKGGDTNLEPFAKLERLYCSALQKIDAHKWLTNIADAGLDPESLIPDFRYRMKNIGHEKIRALPRLTATAAGLYLKDTQASLVSVIDSLWQTNTLPKWIRNRAQRREDIEAIGALSELSRIQRLTLREIVQYARLAYALKGHPYHRSILKLIRRNSTHGKSPRANSSTEALH